MIDENKYFETILSQPAPDYLFKFWNSLENTEEVWKLFLL